MNPAALRQVLVIDWADVENTPTPERKPALEQRWHLRVQRLAEMEGRPVSDVTGELISDAQELAGRNRDRQLTELARDLAVSRALGQKLKPPWRRRLHLLGEITGRPSQAVRDEVESLAANVRVVVQG